MRGRGGYADPGDRPGRGKKFGRDPGTDAGGGVGTKFSRSDKGEKNFVGVRPSQDTRTVRRRVKKTTPHEQKKKSASQGVSGGTLCRDPKGPDTPSPHAGKYSITYWV